VQSTGPFGPLVHCRVRSVTADLENGYGCQFRDYTTMPRYSTHTCWLPGFEPRHSQSMQKDATGLVVYLCAGIASLTARVPGPGSRTCGCGRQATGRLTGPLGPVGRVAVLFVSRRFISLCDNNKGRQGHNPTFAARARMLVTRLRTRPVPAATGTPTRQRCQKVRFVNSSLGKATRRRQMLGTSVPLLPQQTRFLRMSRKKTGNHNRTKVIHRPKSNGCACNVRIGLTFQMTMSAW